MQTRTFNTPKFSALQNLAIVVQTSSIESILASLIRLRDGGLFTGKSWIAGFNKIIGFVSDENMKPVFKVYAKGNSKLPYYSFSTLPGVTCPGAGDCLDFCYSFRAWRYPAAYFRQIQNAMLLRFSAHTLRDELQTLAKANPQGFDFRLYVDGDFSSVSDVGFWFDTLKQNPQARAYGYSKSFDQILAYAARESLPDNYKLNISGGHNASPDVVAQVEALSITRGHFVAVNIGRKVRGSEYGTKPVNDAIRDSMGGVKVFPCPGKCGTCTSVGHACGSSVFTGKVIAIAVH